jgi:hypothetical protein
MATLMSEDMTGLFVPPVTGETMPREFQLDADNTNYGSQAGNLFSIDQTPNPYIQNPFVFEPMRANQPQSIVGGMFSPEISRAAEMDYMMKRQRAMQDEALAYAQLTPMQQAQFGFYRGGQQLGDALGGALGGKDPQLQMIGLQQQILSELDPSNPEQNLMVAQKYARSAPDLAMKIAENARKSMSEMALTTQRLREKQGADPFEQLLRTGKYTPASMAAYKLSKNVADLREVNSPDKIPAKIQEAQTVAKNKGFTEGTPEFNAEVVNYLERPEKETQVQQLQNYRKKLRDSNAPASDIAEVDAAIKALAEGNAPKIIMPGQPVAPKDWLAFSSQISKDPVMDRTSTILADAPSAIETIRMSATNDIAAASLPGSLARLTGEGKNMSNQDVNRFARTGGLDDRLAQDAVGFFTGRKTAVTKEQAERFATAVYRGALLERKKFIKDQAEQAGYDKTPNYDIAIRQLDDQLAKFKLIKPSDKSAPAPKLDADSLVNKYLKPK